MSSRLMAALFVVFVFTMPPTIVHAAGMAANQICFADRVYDKPQFACGQPVITGAEGCKSKADSSKCKISGYNCPCVDTEKAGVVNGHCVAALKCHGDVAKDKDGTTTKLKPFDMKQIQDAIKGTEGGGSSDVDKGTGAESGTAPKEGSDKTDTGETNADGSPKSKSMFDRFFNPEKSPWNTAESGKVMEETIKKSNSETPSFVDQIKNFFTGSKPAETGSSGDGSGSRSSGDDTSSGGASRGTGTETGPQGSADTPASGSGLKEWPSSGRAERLSSPPTDSFQMRPDQTDQSYIDRSNKLQSIGESNYQQQYGRPGENTGFGAPEERTSSETCSGVWCTITNAADTFSRAVMPDTTDASCSGAFSCLVSDVRQNLSDAYDNTAQALADAANNAKEWTMEKLGLNTPIKEASSPGITVGDDVQTDDLFTKPGTDPMVGAQHQPGDPVHIERGDRDGAEWADARKDAVERASAIAGTDNTVVVLGDKSIDIYRGEDFGATKPGTTIVGGENLSGQSLLGVDQDELSSQVENTLLKQAGADPAYGIMASKGPDGETLASKIGDSIAADQGEKSFIERGIDSLSGDPKVLVSHEEPPSVKSEPTVANVEVIPASEIKNLPPPPPGFNESVAELKPEPLPASPSGQVERSELPPPSVEKPEPLPASPSGKVTQQELPPAQESPSQKPEPLPANPSGQVERRDLPPIEPTEKPALVAKQDTTPAHEQPQPAPKPLERVTKAVTKAADAARKTVQRFAGGDTPAEQPKPTASAPNRQPPSPSPSPASQGSRAQPPAPTGSGRPAEGASGGDGSPPAPAGSAPAQAPSAPSNQPRTERVADLNEESCQNTPPRCLYPASATCTSGSWTCAVHTDVATAGGPSPWKEESAPAKLSSCSRGTWSDCIQAVANTVNPISSAQAAKAPSRKVPPAQPGLPIEETEASCYGRGCRSPRFHGQETANGEIYDDREYTAASKTLPFNTKVKVTNKNNGKSVVVRINDRGPYVTGRNLDLSVRAAEVIGSKNSVAPVKLEVVDQKTAVGPVEAGLRTLAELGKTPDDRAIDIINAAQKAKPNISAADIAAKIAASDPNLKLTDTYKGWVDNAARELAGRGRSEGSVKRDEVQKAEDVIAKKVAELKNPPRLRPQLPSAAPPSPQLADALKAAPLPARVRDAVATVAPLPYGYRLYDKDGKELGDVLKASAGAPSSESEARSLAKNVKQIIPKGITLPFAVVDPADPTNPDKITTVWTKEALEINKKLVDAGLPRIVPAYTRHYFASRTRAADGSLTFDSTKSKENAVAAAEKLIAASEAADGDPKTRVLNTKSATEFEKLMTSIKGAELTDIKNNSTLVPKQNLVSADALRMLVLAAALLGQEEIGFVLAATENGHALHKDGADVDVATGPFPLADNSAWRQATVNTKTGSDALAAQFAAYAAASNLLDLPGLRGGVYPTPSLHIGVSEDRWWDQGNPFLRQTKTSGNLGEIASTFRSKSTEDVTFQDFARMRDESVFARGQDGETRYVFMDTKNTTGSQFALNGATEPTVTANKETDPWQEGLQGTYASDTYPHALERTAPSDPEVDPSAAKRTQENERLALEARQRQADQDSADNNRRQEAVASELEKRFAETRRVPIDVSASGPTTPLDANPRGTVEQRELGRPSMDLNDAGPTNPLEANPRGSVERRDLGKPAMDLNDAGPTTPLEGRPRGDIVREPIEPALSGENPVIPVTSRPLEPAKLTPEQIAERVPEPNSVDITARKVMGDIRDAIAGEQKWSLNTLSKNISDVGKGVGDWLSKTFGDAQTDIAGTDGGLSDGPTTPSGSDQTTEPASPAVPYSKPDLAGPDFTESGQEYDRKQEQAAIARELEGRTQGPLASKQDDFEGGLTTARPLPSTQDLFEQGLSDSRPLESTQDQAEGDQRAGLPSEESLASERMADERRAEFGTQEDKGPWEKLKDGASKLWSDWFGGGKPDVAGIDGLSDGPTQPPEGQTETERLADEQRAQAGSQEPVREGKGVLEELKGLIEPKGTTEERIENYKKLLGEGLADPKMQGPTVEGWRSGLAEELKNRIALTQEQLSNLPAAGRTPEQEAEYQKLTSSVKADESAIKQQTDILNQQITKMDKPQLEKYISDMKAVVNGYDRNTPGVVSGINSRVDAAQAELDSRNARSAAAQDQAEGDQRAGRPVKEEPTKVAEGPKTEPPAKEPPAKEPPVEKVPPAKAPPRVPAKWEPKPPPQKPPVQQPPPQRPPTQQPPSQRPPSQQPPGQQQPTGGGTPSPSGGGGFGGGGGGGGLMDILSKLMDGLSKLFGQKKTTPPQQPPVTPTITPPIIPRGTTTPYLPSIPPPVFPPETPPDTTTATTTPPKKSSAVVTLIANPSTLKAGGKTTLTWAAINAIQCDLFGPTGILLGSGYPETKVTSGVLLTTSNFSVRCTAKNGDIISGVTTVTVK